MNTGKLFRLFRRYPVLIAAVLLFGLVFSEAVRAANLKREPVKVECWKELSADEMGMFARVARGIRSIGKMFLLAHDEPGCYLVCAVKVPEGEQQIWGQRSRVEAVLKDGRRISSEACFFFDSPLQTRLFDTRRGTVVVERGALAEVETGWTAMAIRMSEGIQLSKVERYETKGVTRIGGTEQ